MNYDEEVNVTFNLTRTKEGLALIHRLGLEGTPNSAKVELTFRDKTQFFDRFYFIKITDGDRHLYFGVSAEEKSNQLGQLNVTRQAFVPDISQNVPQIVDGKKIVDFRNSAGETAGTVGQTVADLAAVPEGIGNERVFIETFHRFMFTSGDNFAEPQEWGSIARKTESGILLEGPITPISSGTIPDWVPALLDAVKAVINPMLVKDKHLLENVGKIMPKASPLVLLT